MKYFLAPFSKWSIELGVLQHKSTKSGKPRMLIINTVVPKMWKKIKINTCAWMKQTFLN